MPNFLVLGIYLFLLFSGNGDGTWTRFLHGGSVEDDGGINVNNFICLMTWRLGFPNGDIKAEMMSPPWNNFLRSLLCFVVVRSDHNKGLVRISFRSVFLILQWQKEEEERHKKEEDSLLRLQKCWPSFVGHMLSGLLPSVCLYGLLYESSNRFGVEMLGYTKHGYKLDDQDVPFVLFNINEPAAAHRPIRARRMAPVLLGKRLIPVAPLKNPLYGVSHHRIRLHDPANIHCVVELFFRDTDLYFAGFCRGVVAADGAEPQWGRVFIFDDLYKDAPAFLNAAKMSMLSDHTNKGDAPGPEAVMQLFETFFKFEDDIEMIRHDSEGNPQAKGVVGDIKQALQNAVARAIIIFSEALRLKSVYTSVLEALQSFYFFRHLPARCWKLIRWWGQLSDEVQTLRRNHRMALNTNLPRRFSVVGLDTLGQLIGKHGELAFCKLDMMMVIPQEQVAILQDDIRRVNFVDPTFQEQPPPPLPPQPQEEEGGGGRGRGRGGRGREGARGGRGRGEGRGGRGGEAEVAAGGRGRGGRARGRGRGGRGW